MRGFFTTRPFILTYDDTILRRRLIERGVSLKTDVLVSLSTAKILSYQLEEDSVEVFSEKPFIFTPFTAADFTVFQAD